MKEIVYSEEFKQECMATFPKTEYGIGETIERMLAENDPNLGNFLYYSTNMGENERRNILSMESDSEGISSLKRRAIYNEKLMMLHEKWCKLYSQSNSVVEDEG